MKLGGLIQFLAKWQQGIKALVNMMSHIWREEGERKKGGRGEKWDCWWGWVSVLRGFTTWTMNTRNETDHQHHPFYSLVSTFLTLWMWLKSYHNLKQVIMYKSNQEGHTSLLYLCFFKSVFFTKIRRFFTYTLHWETCFLYCVLMHACSSLLLTKRTLCSSTLKRIYL